MTGQPTFPTLLEGFFTRRLMQQRQASVHTVASYRDTFRLLLQFAQRRLRKAPSTLAIEDINVSLVGDFLDELEKVRHVTARTRNLRLTAIHSFFRYVAFEAPAHAAQTQRVLAIPAKRFTRALVPFLSRQEVDALLAAPDRRTRSGRRDHALILLAVQAGLRLSELTGLRPQDLHLGTGAHVRVIGKGRKERCTPLSKNTRSVIAAWLRELPNVPDQPLFPSARGGHLSAHGVHYLLAKHVATATHTCPSLKRKRVSPHVLRHTTAMDLLQQGVEQAVIALWLGHESIETTQVYLDADLELKQRVLDGGKEHRGNAPLSSMHQEAIMDEHSILAAFSQADGLPRAALRAAAADRVRLAPRLIALVEEFLTLPPAERPKQSPSSSFSTCSATGVRRQPIELLRNSCGCPRSTCVQSWATPSRRRSTVSWCRCSMAIPSPCSM